MNLDKPPIINTLLPQIENDYMVIIEKVHYNPGSMFAVGSPGFMLFAYAFHWLSSFKVTTEQYGPYDYRTAFRLKQLNDGAKILQISTNQWIN